MLSFRIIISAIKRTWIALALSRCGVCFEVYAAHPSGVIRAETCGADRKKRDGGAPHPLAPVSRRQVGG